MRRFTSSVVAATLVVGPIPDAGFAHSAGVTASLSPGTMCRRAPSLPVLPAEIVSSQQQTSDVPTRTGVRRSASDGKAETTAVDADAGEVMVTAHRRERSAEDSPIAVSAIDGGTLAKGESRSIAPPPPPAYAPPPPPPPSPVVAPSVALSSPVPPADARSAVLPPRPYPPKPQPVPQSGQLTAGDHDDLRNPELYAEYVRRSNLGQDMPGLPVLDTGRMLTVRVADDQGRPVAFADVEVTCADGNTLTLATQSDGTVRFFPALDRLGRDVRIAAHKDGRKLAAARDVTISSGPGGQTIGITSDQSAVAATKLDLMLVIDTTGSMGDEIRYLQSELEAILASVQQRHRGIDIRVGFVFYRDRGDDYVTRTVGFDRNFGRVRGVLAQQRAYGGGDYPEAMDQALIRAVGQDWRPDAVKSLLLVADAPPHSDRIAPTWAAAEVARAKRIHITPIAASGVADEAEYAMRAMAALTQSRYLFLTDDSGIGNPHAPPAVACYLVTRLDNLVRRVIDGQISGRRIEPDDSEIIRTVGQYDGGTCILPPDFPRGQS